MVGLWLLCLVCVAAGSVLPRDETNAPCTPGTLWMTVDDCNTCFCMENGMPECTRMDCSARKPAAKRDYDDFSKPLPLPEPEPMEQREGVNCSQDDKWEEECNSCFCVEDGVALCTQMVCSGGSRALAEAVADHCKPGETWGDDCNVCHCVGGSQVVCSHGACPLPQTSERRRRQAGCTPGVARQVGCNRCLCLSTGVEACTKKFCLSPATEQASRASNSGNSDCVQVCPADCGSRRGDDGCLVCECGPDPFFGVLPPLPTAPESDGRWGGQGWQLGRK